jgi:hypothetical protein
VEPKFKSIIAAWRSALEVRLFRIKFSISIALIIGCAIIAPVIFQFIQQRKGIVLTDYLLNNLPSINLSVWIFVILYILIITSIFSLAANPKQFLFALQGYILLTILRFITLLLIPLEPPLNMAELNDPFVQKLFYQQLISKDLFFSGHTSLLVLLAMTVPDKSIRYVLFMGTILIVIMLLIQHVHYTVDILFAPLFSWLAFRGSKAIFNWNPLLNK